MKKMTNSWFVRSLFAHCSLFVRLAGEETAVKLHDYSKAKAKSLEQRAESRMWCAVAFHLCSLRLALRPMQLPWEMKSESNP